MARDARWVRSRWAPVLGIAFAAASLVGCSDDEPSSDAAPSTTATSAAAPACASHDWVASWGAAPSDASFPQDATFAPIPARFEDQTVRNVITPHLGSSGEVRVHLTNQFNVAPVTFERVSIGVSAPGGGVDAPVPVLFDGSGSVTAPAGESVISDALELNFDAFEPLAVSLYLPSTAGQLTKHWNANATTFITPVGGGDQTTASGGEAFTQQVYSWFAVSAIDVQHEPGTRALVALGDSLTDGWVGTSSTETVLDVTVADTNVRYPDFLQHRLDDAGIPMSVVNAGLGGNQILTGVGPTGPGAVERFAADVTTVAGVEGVIIFEGINDLGLSQAPATDIIEGLEELVAQARAADLAVWLATITPASDSVVDGVVSAPNSERDRQVINDWIRTEADVDGVFDFDAAVRDPANPAVLSTRYGSPDRLHLSAAGYEELAETVDLEAISQAGC